MHCVNYLPLVRQEEGGVVRAVLDLCSVLATQGHRVTLVTLDAAELPEQWGRPGEGGLNAVVLAGPATKNRLGRRSMAMLESVIGDADVVHLHDPWTPSNRQVARVSQRCGKPYVVTIHGMLDDWSMAIRTMKKRLYLALGGRRFLERAARVHCTAEAEKQQASKWFPQGKPVVLPYIFDLTPFHHLPGPKLARESLGLSCDGVPQILFLSRLHPKKGVEILIDAAAILQRRKVPFHLLLAGPGEPGYCEGLRQQVGRLQLDKAVQFLGMIRGEQKVSLYQASDLFVLPTNQENFGLVLAEAMACRTPVITTRGVDIWQELQQGDAAIVDQTPEAIASAISQMLEDPDALPERGRRGRDFIFQWLDAQTVASRYEAMYLKIMSDHVS